MRYRHQLESSRLYAIKLIVVQKEESIKNSIVTSFMVIVITLQSIILLNEQSPRNQGK